MCSGLGLRVVCCQILLLFADTLQLGSMGPIIIPTYFSLLPLVISSLLITYSALIFNAAATATATAAACAASAACAATASTATTATATTAPAAATTIPLSLCIARMILLLHVST